jgi:hypothetical protein
LKDIIILSFQYNDIFLIFNITSSFVANTTMFKLQIF